MLLLVGFNSLVQTHNYVFYSATEPWEVQDKGNPIHPDSLVEGVWLSGPMQVISQLKYFQHNLFLK